MKMKSGQKRGVVLAVGAHPDDVEFLMAGTLAHLFKRGYKIFMATFCTGDMGSMELGSQEIASIRFKEATDSAKMLRADYFCLGESDLHLVFNNPTRFKAVELVRKVDPDIVITHSPVDYMLDHQIAADLMWDACFNAPIPNYTTNQANPARPTNRIPFLFYADAIGGVDRFGERVRVDFYVDISSTISIKERMLARHKSQREWLRAQHGIDEYILQMRRWSELRGFEIGRKFAEAFRQHRGHPFPEENILASILANICVVPQAP
ncbi:MAG: PIG-L family deacetylase [Candidatus Bathyarchaeia archaeon]